MQPRATPKKKEPRVVALIPARGGGISTPSKNIKLLEGRPLIDWVIRPALDSGIFAEVWVSTDDDRIATVATACGAQVFRRSAATATATASTESAIKEFVVAHADFDALCLIQATSPLSTPADFIKGWQLMRATNADSLVTAVRTHRFLWSMDARAQFASAKNYEPLHRPRRQDWNGELIENGAFYFTARRTWEMCAQPPPGPARTRSRPTVAHTQIHRARAQVRLPAGREDRAARDGRAHAHRSPRVAARLEDG